MHWFLVAADVLSVGIIASFLFALVAIAFRKWSAARVIARGAFFGSVAVFAALSLMLALMSVSPSVVSLALPSQINGGEADPSEKARALAETISEMMNTGALGVLAAFPIGVVWWIAHRRARATGRGAG